MNEKLYIYIKPTKPAKKRYADSATCRAPLSVLLEYSQRILTKHSETNQMIYMLLFNSRRANGILNLVCNNVTPHNTLFFKNFRYNRKNFQDILTNTK